MCIVHPFDWDGPAVLDCAQPRCQDCLDALIRRHDGLVHVVLRRQSRGGVAYEDLLQEGRIALWQAVLHFDPQCRAAFSTYAGVAIKRQIWRAVARSTRPQGWLSLPERTASRGVPVTRMRVLITVAASLPVTPRPKRPPLISTVPIEMPSALWAAWSLSASPSSMETSVWLGTSGGLPLVEAAHRPPELRRESQCLPGPARCETLPLVRAGQQCQGIHHRA